MCLEHVFFFIRSAEKAVVANVEGRMTLEFDVFSPHVISAALRTESQCSCIWRTEYLRSGCRVNRPHLRYFLKAEAITLHV